MSRGSSPLSRSGCKPTCRRAARCYPSANTAARNCRRRRNSVYGKPGKGDLIGHYLDPQSGAVKTIAYRMPEPKKPAKPAPGGTDRGETTDVVGDVAPKTTRSEVTQKGTAMIGDFRTDALHQALKDAAIDETRLIALLVLALAAKNVSVQSGTGQFGSERAAIATTLIEGGVLTSDQQTIHAAARTMLTAVLSCRANMSDSGIVARVAGDAIDASLHLPNMATEAFLSCLSKAGIEKAAAAEGVRVQARGKDTRAGLVERFKSGTYVFPGALLQADRAGPRGSPARDRIPLRSRPGRWRRTAAR